MVFFLSWHKFLISGYFHKVDMFSWRLPIFMKFEKLHYFWMKLAVFFIFAQCFSFFNEVDKISCFSHIAWFCVFLRNWQNLYFMWLAKFYSSCVFLCCWQNSMILHQFAYFRTWISRSNRYWEESISASRGMEWEIDWIRQKQLIFFSRKKLWFIWIFPCVKFFFHRAILIWRHWPLLYAGLNGRWTKFGGKIWFPSRKSLRLICIFP